MEIKKYTKDQKQIWNEFVDNSKNGTFMINRDYMDYHSDRFEDFSLMFYEEDKLTAIMPASKHGGELCSHGGLTYGGIISNEKMKAYKMLDIFSSMLEFLKVNGIESLLYKCMPYIYHDYPSDEDLYALFRNNAKLIRRDIASVIDFSHQYKMPKGRKAQISRAKREGVVIEESSDYVTFIALENKILTAKHNAIAVHNANELKYLSEKFPENIKLFVAKYNDEIIAGTLLFIYKNIVHTQYMASDEISREIGGLDFLLKTLIEKYYGNKRYFDFGISTEDCGRYLNEGLISQKEGFGGRAVVYDFYKWTF